MCLDKAFWVIGLMTWDFGVQTMSHHIFIANKLSPADSSIILASRWQNSVQNAGANRPIQESNRYGQTVFLISMSSYLPLRDHVVLSVLSV